jgi:hypothetical protein
MWALVIEFALAVQYRSPQIAGKLWVSFGSYKIPLAGC